MTEKQFIPNIMFLIIGLSFYTYLVIVIDKFINVIILLFTLLFLGWSISFGEYKTK